jgi:ABC-type transporter Mla MlaB component
MDAGASGLVPVDASRLSADLGTIDLLARQALTARRAGHQIVLHGASEELLDLIELAGLAQVIRAAEA